MHVRFHFYTLNLNIEDRTCSWRNSGEEEKSSYGTHHHTDFVRRWATMWLESGNVGISLPLSGFDHSLSQSYAEAAADAVQTGAGWSQQTPDSSHSDRDGHSGSHEEASFPTDAKERRKRT